MNRRLWPVALVLLAGCRDGTAQWLATPEGRAACAAAGGHVGLIFNQSRCYRMIRIDTVRALVVEDTAEGRR